jgi:hypothetical protein
MLCAAAVRLLQRDRAALLPSSCLGRAAPADNCKTAVSRGHYQLAADFVARLTANAGCSDVLAFSKTAALGSRPAPARLL